MRGFYYGEVFEEISVMLRNFFPKSCSVTLVPQVSDLSILFDIEVYLRNL